MSKRFTALLVVMLLVGTASLVAAPAARQADQPSVAANAGESDWVVDRAIMRDERTGAWRKPTREETIDLVRTLKQLTRRSSEGLQVTAAADGTQTADLGDGFNQVILARANEEGGTEILCVSTFEEAAEFLGLRVQPKTQPKREGAQQ